MSRELFKTLSLLMLIGAFVSLGCGWKAISEVEYAQCMGERELKLGTQAMLRVFLYSEKKAHEIASGKKPAGREETERAKEFIADLKTISDALPVEQQFLKTNGRPVYISTSTTVQQESMLNVLLGMHATVMQDPKVQAASRRLAAAMSELREDMSLGRPPNQTMGDYGPPDTPFPQTNQ